MSGLHSTLPSGIPLIVRANSDESIKRIRFPPDLSSLQFIDFHRKIAKSLQFQNVDFCIIWEDDDGECVSEKRKKEFSTKLTNFFFYLDFEQTLQTEIESTEDLQEAIYYFCPSEFDSSLESLSMRVSIRVDTRVSLSDYDSSIWGESDEEGTHVSGSSQSARSRAILRSKAKKTAIISSSRSSTTSPSAVLSPIDYSNVSFKTGLGSARIDSLPLSQEYQNDNLTRWMGSSNQFSPESNSSQTNRNYKDALSSFNSLSAGDLSSTEDWDESTDTRGPNHKKKSSRRSPAALEDGTSIHHGVQCKSCKMTPIIGLRFHCPSCVYGADFVSGPRYL